MHASATVVINNIQTYQKHKYAFTVVPQLRNYLLSQPLLSLVLHVELDRG